MRRKNELLIADLEFFDSLGRKIAELRGFTLKLVRGAVALQPSMEERAPKTITPVPRAPLAEAVPAGSAASDAARMLLKEIVAERLKCTPDAVPGDSGYYELGLDSAMLLEVVAALNQRLALSLAPTLLFEYSTIDELAAYLAAEHPDNFSAAGAAAPAEASVVPASEAKPAVIGSSAVQDEPIAIVGLAGRYPESDGIAEFWANLKLGKDCIREIPPERWDWHALDALRSPSGKPMSRWGGFVKDADCFDPRFFRISPREAEIIDPQERLFLQACWEAIEDAGYTPANAHHAPRAAEKARCGRVRWRDA